MHGDGRRMKKPKTDKSKHETAAAPAEVPAFRATVDALQEKIAELETLNTQLREQYLRLQADYANHEKRTLKRIADDVDREKRTLLQAMLPSLDNFPAALAHAEAAKDASPDAVHGVIEGVRRVFQHLLDALAAQGVARIEATGQPFDPAVHEAMMQRCEPEQPDGIVLEEVQAGYQLNGRLLRPAKVIVNKQIDTTEPDAVAQDNESGVESDGE